MSTYYNYYIGYEHEGKLFPFGPYNGTGELRPVISRSASFASELHNQMWEAGAELFSEKLVDTFGLKKDDTDIFRRIIYWLYLDELPTDDYVKTGYFLKSDVEAYEKEHDSWDLFYDCVTPTVYASMVQDELMFGAPKEKKDCAGTPYIPHAASDYMFYAYADCHCEEYEANRLRFVANMLNGYKDLPEGAKLVVLMTIT